MFRSTHITLSKGQVCLLQCDISDLQICLGTVSTVEEAVQWLSYTYLFIRMRANPLVYGIKQDYKEVSK